MALGDMDVALLVVAGAPGCTFIFLGRHSTLDVWCCMVFANCIGSAASSIDTKQIFLAGMVRRENVIFAAGAACACGVMSCFMAGAAIFGTLFCVCVQVAFSTLAALREVRCCLGLSRHWAWQAQYLVRLRPATLSVPGMCMSPLHILHSKLRTSHSAHHALYTPPFTLHPQHPPLHTPLDAPHPTLPTPSPHFTLRIPHYTLCFLHSTPYSPRFTLQIPHSTLPNLRSPLYTLHSTPYTLHFALFTLYTAHSTLYAPHFTLHTPHSRLPHSTLGTLHSRLHTPHSPLHTLHSTLHIVILQTPHSRLHTLHSAIYTSHPAVSTRHSHPYTLRFLKLHILALHSTHYTLHHNSMLYTSHSTLYRSHSARLTLDSALHM